MIYLCWPKHDEQFDSWQDNIWVDYVVAKLLYYQLWQWLEQGCHKPMLGVCADSSFRFDQVWKAVFFGVFFFFSFCVYHMQPSVVKSKVCIIILYAMYILTRFFWFDLSVIYKMFRDWEMNIYRKKSRRDVIYLQHQLIFVFQFTSLIIAYAVLIFASLFCSVYMHFHLVMILMQFQKQTHQWK